MTATKIQPGDDTHLTSLMALHSLNLVTGPDRAALLAYGRDVFAAARDSKCLAQIDEPAGAAPVAAAGPAPAGWQLVPATPTREWIASVADGGYEDCDCASLIADILSRAPAAPALEAPPAVAPQGEYPHEQMDAMALDRYKVVPSNASMLWSHAVVAGDGTQQLYVGREVECQNMARKFAGAFLDGAFAFHSTAAASTAPAAPALEAPAAPAVPAGFALVPIEPTQQMLDAGRWSGAGSVSIQEEWARKEMWSRMLATITPPPAAYTDDLVALVENLAQALSAAAPDNDLAGHALNYLKRNGLQRSPLRAAEAAPQALAAPVGLPWRTGIPPWTDDRSVHVIAVTAHDDFGGVQVHDIRASDFHTDGDGDGAEVARVCTHWAYRDDIWPRADAVAPAAPIPWDNFPAYLIDHCEGQTITEEGLQRALSAMLANPQYVGAAPAAPAVDAADSARLDFVLQKDAFIVWTDRDDTIRQCQLMTQDEDEHYHVISGEHRFFNAPRQAIDAAIAAQAAAKGE